MTTGQRVGYIRVSTAEQNEVRQLDGVDLYKTFTDTSARATTRASNRDEGSMPRQIFEIDELLDKYVRLVDDGNAWLPIITEVPAPDSPEAELLCKTLEGILYGDFLDGRCDTYHASSYDEDLYDDPYVELDDVEEDASEYEYDREVVLEEIRREIAPFLLANQGGSLAFDPNDVVVSPPKPRADLPDAWSDLPIAQMLETASEDDLDANLLRHLWIAQTASDTAKGMPGYGVHRRYWTGDDTSYRSMRALIRQQYGIKDAALRRVAGQLNTTTHDLRWGWRHDPLTPTHSQVLYVDLPTGQVSFHQKGRGDGPAYEGDWDGVRGMAKERIEAAIEAYFSDVPGSRA